MLVTNHQNGQPQIIEDILSFLEGENLDNIVSIENHKGDLTVVFYNHPKKLVLTIIKAIWYECEGSENYKFYVVSGIKEIKEYESF